MDDPRGSADFQNNEILRWKWIFRFKCSWFVDNLFLGGSVSIFGEIDKHFSFLHLELIPPFFALEIALFIILRLKIIYYFIFAR